MGKRSRSGAASRPVRVVAPMSVKRSSFISMVCAPMPAPSTTSKRKSSMAG